MEDLIRKILNVEYDNNQPTDIVNNYFLFSEFIKHSNNQVTKLTDYQSSDVKIELLDNLDNNFSNAIVIDKDSLIIDNPLGFMADLLDLAEQTLNITQRDNIINHNETKPFNTIVRYNDTFSNRLFFHIFSFIRSCISSNDNQITEEVENALTRKFDYIERYLHALAWSQPCIIEAENFSNNVLKEILEKAETMELNEHEKDSLNQLKSAYLEFMSVIQESRETNKEFRNHDMIREKIQKTIYDIREYVLKSDPNYLRRHIYIDSDILKTRLEEDIYNIFDFIDGLSINYNDRLAHEILLYLLHNRNNDPNIYNAILQLITQTNIELNKTEEKSVRKLLKENNFITSFDELMIEKSKFSDYRNEFLKEPTLYM